MKSFKEIRAEYPDKFLLLENCQIREMPGDQVEVVAAGSVKPFDSFKEVYSAYRNLKSQGRDVIFCTPRYAESFIFERQPSARVMG